MSSNTQDRDIFQIGPLGVATRWVESIMNDSTASLTKKWLAFLAFYVGMKLAVGVCLMVIMAPFIVLSVMFPPTH